MTVTDHLSDAFFFQLSAAESRHRKRSNLRRCGADEVRIARMARSNPTPPRCSNSSDWPVLTIKRLFYVTHHLMIGGSGCPVLVVVNPNLQMASFL